MFECLDSHWTHPDDNNDSGDLSKSTREEKWVWTCKSEVDEAYIKYCSESLKKFIKERANRKCYYRNPQPIQTIEIEVPG